MPLNQTTIIYALILAAVVLFIQSVMGMMKESSKSLRLANDRLKRLAKGEKEDDALASLRRIGSTQGEGYVAELNIRAAKLVLQSGLPIGHRGLYLSCFVLAISLGITLFLLKGSYLLATIGVLVGAVLPIFMLSFFVKRRQKRALKQLPEALDIVIRSLAAGHPVSVAISLVAKEMPDPIGSEFGIASDEVAFGSTIPAAIEKMSERIGHEDFELFSAMIRLQERTGGNLAELLRSNAKTIRDRQKMRLKIKAASAEGKMSAIILNVAPILLFLSINKMSPEFYGEVKDSPVLTYALWGVVVWMGIGNLVMRKMINFKI